MWFVHIVASNEPILILFKMCDYNYIYFYLYMYIPMISELMYDYYNYYCVKDMKRGVIDLLGENTSDKIII